MMDAYDSEYERIVAEANAAKERLSQVAEKLEEIGARRKAKSCRRLAWNIEVWQHTKR